LIGSDSFNCDESYILRCVLSVEYSFSPHESEKESILESIFIISLEDHSLVIEFDSSPYFHVDFKFNFNIVINSHPNFKIIIVNQDYTRKITYPIFAFQILYLINK
jgi:hypothetical protein